MTTENEEVITIPLSVYNELHKDAETLNALYAAGVDNWDGYDAAMELLENNP